MLEVEGNIYDLTRDAISYEGVVEIFKGWLQHLNLSALKPGTDIKSNALATIKYMELIFDQIKKEKNIDLYNFNPTDDDKEFDNQSFF